MTTKAEIGIQLINEYCDKIILVIEKQKKTLYMARNNMHLLFNWDGSKKETLL